jgi:ApaG protein
MPAPEQARHLRRRRLFVHHGQTMSRSEAVTRGIRVRVEAEYSPERSNPRSHHWFFLYTVTIANEGDETVQLVSRHWVITDGNSHVEEVKGPGVVGEQPVLGPGESFTYTSGCPLPTPYGMMEGTYQMVGRGGDRFDARIAPFTLSEPHTVH